MQVTKHCEDKYATLMVGKEVLVFYFDEDSTVEEMCFSCCSLTAVGREILSLADIPLNEEYLKAIATEGIKMGASKVGRGLATEQLQAVSIVDFVPEKPKSPPIN